MRRSARGSLIHGMRWSARAPWSSSDRSCPSSCPPRWPKRPSPGKSRYGLDRTTFSTYFHLQCYRDEPKSMVMKVNAMSRPLLLRWLLFVLGPFLFTTGSRAALPEAAPEPLGFDPARLSRIDDAVKAAIDEHKVPGAVVVVGRRGKIALARAYGRRAILPA